MQKRSKIVSVISYAGISTLIMAGFQVMLSSAPLTAMAQSATATPTPAKAASKHAVGNSAALTQPWWLLHASWPAEGPSSFQCWPRL